MLSKNTCSEEIPKYFCHKPRCSNSPSLIPSFPLLFCVSFIIAIVFPCSSKMGTRSHRLNHILPATTSVRDIKMKFQSFLSFDQFGAWAFPCISHWDWAHWLDRVGPCLHLWNPGYHLPGRMGKKAIFESKNEELLPEAGGMEAT